MSDPNILGQVGVKIEKIKQIKEWDKVPFSLPKET
jgi:hypothetical protein